jgi:4,5-DOPA dioxygenase extradiol
MKGLSRRAFLRAAVALAAAQGFGRGAAADGKKGEKSMIETGQKADPPRKRMPVLFVGHGSPMNAIEDNAWSRGFRDLVKSLPRPAAILAISAHWYVAGTFTTANEHPETIHDFGGFPEELYRVRYPAPGSVDLARRAVALVGEKRASLRADWGLDHGTWSVLLHLRPAADVPVVQLSIDRRLPPAEHIAIGRALAPLRDEGVLVMGSGNVTHNLRHAFSARSGGDRETPDWARSFDDGIATALASNDLEHLARAPETEAGRLSHPTPDHYLPLLYAAGASDPKDPVRFPITGFDMGSLSMRSVIFG